MSPTTFIDSQLTNLQAAELFLTSNRSRTPAINQVLHNYFTQTLKRSTERNGWLANFIWLAGNFISEKSSEIV